MQFTPSLASTATIICNVTSLWMTMGYIVCITMYERGVDVLWFLVVSLWILHGFMCLIGPYPSRSIIHNKAHTMSHSLIYAVHSTFSVESHHMVIAQDYINCIDDSLLKLPIGVVSFEAPSELDENVTPCIACQWPTMYLSDIENWTPRGFHARIWGSLCD